MHGQISGQSKDCLHNRLFGFVLCAQPMCYNGCACPNDQVEEVITYLQVLDELELDFVLEEVAEVVDEVV